MRRMMAVLVVVGCGDAAHEVVVQTVSEYGGAPIAGVAVQLDDGAWVTTDATGTARFHARAAPHGVRIHQTSAGTTPAGKPYELHDVWSLIDQTDDPLVIPVDGSTAPTQHRATISGTVTGASGTVLVSARSDAYRSAAQTVTAADGTFTLTDVTWEGADPHPITVEALAHDAGDPPAHYVAHGMVSVTASDGGQLGGVALALAPVSEDHVRGTVALPGDLAGELHPFLSLAFADGSAISVNTGTPLASGGFDFVFPVIPGASPRITFEAIASSGANSTAERTLALPTSNVTFALPSTVTASAPADGATVGPATVFQWTSVPGGAKYGLTLACDWTQDGTLHDANYRIIEAADPQATVPVIPELGIPSGTPCTWSVAWFEGSADGLETTARADARRYSYSAEHPIRIE